MTEITLNINDESLAAARSIGISEREAAAILLRGCVAAKGRAKAEKAKTGREVLIDPLLHNRLKALARAKGITPYAALRQAVERFLACDDHSQLP